MTVGRLRLAGFLLVGALLVAAGYPFVSQVAAPILNPVGSALKDWTCADQARVTQVSFCVTLPPPSPTDQVAWNIGQEVTAARIGLMATAHGISLQTVPMTWGDLSGYRSPMEAVPAAGEHTAMILREFDRDRRPPGR